VKYCGAVPKKTVTEPHSHSVPFRAGGLREKPHTKVGQVRQAWPDIKDLLAAGHSLKHIWAWLNEIGLEIGYARLSHYIGQLRRRDEAAQTQTQELRR
jgi:hypothetical protein